jgi:serpin B
MRIQRSLRATALAVVLVVAACDTSVVPSASPSSASSPSPIPSPSAPASALAPSPIATEPAPSDAPAGDLVPGGLAVTVSDRLRVRSKPEVADDSARYEPLLPTGTQLQVLEGPVEGSGYQWVRVAPVDVQLDGGVTDGWVAIADHDGTPWVEASAAPLAVHVVQASVKRDAPDPADAKRAAGEVNAFGLALYKRLIADPDLRGDGVVMSPASIAFALAMARAGAEGRTATQMDDVLRATGWSDLGSGLGSLQQELGERNASWTDSEDNRHALSLNLVNNAFGQDGWTIRKPYLDRIGRAFGSGLSLVDYIRDSAEARSTINDWVARQTANRIKHLLGPTDVTENTRLVLVNAIYLKANWAHEFIEGGTRDRPFRTAGGSTVQVPMMRLIGGQDVPLAQGDGWQATELRYLGGDDGSTPLSMTLIRPNRLAAFERSLTPAKLADIQAELRAQSKSQARVKVDPASDMGCETYAYNVNLFVPRFGIETRALLGPMLTAMGMRDAFDPSAADFSGITDEGLFIARVIHQANIDVDETGTEAAAATAVIGDTTGGCGGPSPRQTKVLRFDRPFVYLIRDTRTGAILFMGRVTDPTTR